MPLIKHRLSHTKSYQVWANIKGRCTNPNRHNWLRYGGRGITLALEWLDFANFYRDMGDPPFPDAQLDRRDNDGNYCKENCRWVSPAINSQNRGVYKSNSSGLPGLHYEPERNRWKARVQTATGQRLTIYTGPSLLEAACKLKTWKNQNDQTNCNKSAVPWF